MRLPAIQAGVGKDRLQFVGQVALAAWFADWTYVRIASFVARNVPVGQDIVIYYRGVRSWLNGGDPWAASVIVGHQTLSYAGSPGTTVLLAPSALLSESQFTILWLGLTALSP